MGKKQKRKNESSDEISDTEQMPRHTLKEEDPQVSITFFFPRNEALIELDSIKLLYGYLYSSSEAIFYYMVEL